MEPYKVGIIGCGRSGAEGREPKQGLSHHHAAGYEASDAAVIVACADIVEEYADAYKEQHELASAYTDYREMLDKEDLDIVSIITWPHLHAEMAIAAAESGVKAVHCEKPMAITFGDSKGMLAACEKNGVQLTIDHQRRFGPPFRRARDLVAEGAIGQLQSMTSRCGNLYDWGTHWFDMQFFINGQVPAEWVIGQVDVREPGQVFGAWLESHGISQFKFENDVRGSLLTGPSAGSGPEHRLVGTEGMLELGVPDGPALRLLNGDAAGWQAVEVEGGMHGEEFFKLAIHDLIDALQSGREPELAGRKALMATELIFATYESSRRRGRVDLPLDIEDSPLLDLLGKA